MSTLLYIAPTVFQIQHWCLDDFLTDISLSYRNLAPAKQTETITRIIGTVLQLFVCTSYFYVVRPEQIGLIMNIFTGHMIYDIFYVETWAFRIHHAACILLNLLYHYGMKDTMNISYDDMYYVYKGVVLLESTSPLLNTCWLLHTYGYPDNGLHKVLKAITAIYWTVARMVVLPYMLLTDGVAYSKIFFYPFIPLNILWFSAIVKKVRKELGF